MVHPRLTIPRAEADTFAASAAINKAVWEWQWLNPTAGGLIKNKANIIACDLLSGKTVLTVDDEGHYVEVVLAEEPAKETKE